MASSIPATSLKFTRVSSPPSARRALERPNWPSMPPLPACWLARRARKTNSATSSSTGPNENSTVCHRERSSGGRAFTVTVLSCSSRDSDWSSANAGISVSNFFASSTSFLYSPWTVSPLEEISFTLPLSTCSMKAGV